MGALAVARCTPRRVHKHASGVATQSSGPEHARKTAKLFEEF
jgi:hypothetical protein